MITAVFDTNIYISAIGFDKIPEQLIRLAHHQAFTLYISPDIKAEITSTLTRKFHHSATQVKNDLRMVELATQVVFPKESVHLITTDPSDNKILECCLTAKADYLVSGDKKHLLPLKSFKSTKIVSATQFFDTIKS